MEGAARLSEIGQATSSSAALASDDTDTVIGVSRMDGGDPGVYDLQTTQQLGTVVHNEMYVSIVTQSVTKGSPWTVPLPVV